MKTIPSVFLPLLAISIILFSAVSAQILSSDEGHYAATSTPQSRSYFPLVYKVEPTQTPLPTLTRTPTPTGTLLPDLYIQHFHITYYEDCAWGSPGLLSVGVINNGLRDSGEFTVAINLKYAFVEGLQAQATTDASIEFENGPLGHLFGSADIYDEVDESDESNNDFIFILTPPPRCTPSISPTP